jgi:hypothetical protein
VKHSQLTVSFGGVPERSKGSDCKSDGSAFEGSNPSPSTRSAADNAGVIVFCVLSALRDGPGSVKGGAGGALAVRFDDFFSEDLLNASLDFLVLIVPDAGVAQW